MPFINRKSKREIDHPYWLLYNRLTDLRISPNTNETKNSIRQLAIDGEITTLNHLFLNTLMLLPNFNAKWIQQIFFNEFKERFSYSLLSPSVIETISNYSPIVELGAGNGYNAWLLNQIGVDITAIDANPVTEGKNWFYLNAFGFPKKSVHSWIHVQKGDSESLKSFTEHTLFLCWPPRNAMALKSLFYYSGKRIIFVGNKDTCAGIPFYDKLSREWHLELSIKTGSWDSIHTEWFEIYYRWS